MAELKTKKTDASVSDFINAFADSEQKRKDSFELLKLMQDFTGFDPKMWGASMIGFGYYHYKSERSSYIPASRSTSTCCKIWGNSKRGRTAFISRNCRTSIRMRSINS